MIITTTENRQRVESAFPGLRCNRIEIWDHQRSDGRFHLWISVSGSTENLMLHGMLTQRMLDQLPKCGHARFYKDKAEFHANVGRNAKGYRVERSYDDDDARAFIEKNGLEIPRQDKDPICAPEDHDDVREPWIDRVARAAGEEYAVSGIVSRSRTIGRFQRAIRWNTVGKMLIIPDWTYIRAAAHVARQTQ